MLEVLLSAFLSLVPLQDALPAPVTGQVAPPLGDVRWLQVEAEEDGVTPITPDLLALRGRVVVVHTYGYYCDT